MTTKTVTISEVYSTRQNSPFKTLIDQFASSIFGSQSQSLLINNVQHQTLPNGVDIFSGDISGHQISLYYHNLDVALNYSLPSLDLTSVFPGFSLFEDLSLIDVDFAISKNDFNVGFDISFDSGFSLLGNLDFSQTQTDFGRFIYNDLHINAIDTQININPNVPSLSLTSTLSTDIEFFNFDGFSLTLTEASLGFEVGVDIREIAGTLGGALELTDYDPTQDNEPLLTFNSEVSLSATQIDISGGLSTETAWNDPFKLMGCQISNLNFRAGKSFASPLYNMGFTADIAYAMNTDHAMNFDAGFYIQPDAIAPEIGLYFTAQSPINLLQLYAGPMANFLYSTASGIESGVVNKITDFIDIILDTADVTIQSLKDTNNEYLPFLSFAPVIGGVDIGNQHIDQGFGINGKLKVGDLSLLFQFNAGEDIGKMNAKIGFEYESVYFNVALTLDGFNIIFDVNSSLGDFTLSSRQVAFELANIGEVIWEGFLSAIGQMAEWVADVFEDVVDMGIEAIEDIGNFIYEQGSAIFEAVVAFFEDAWEAFSNWVQGIDDPVQYAGSYTSEFIGGGNNHDILFGNGGNDTINGLENDDVIDGGSGNDALFGGSGKDSINGANGDDQIWGEDGSDNLYGWFGSDNIRGGDGFDLIDGGMDNDTIDGGDGNDKLYGSAGDDYIYDSGHAVQPIYSMPNARDLILGDDWLDGGQGNDTLLSGEGYDTVYGGAGNDYIYTDAQGDLVFGDEGNDYIDGGDGNDTVNGGIGDDTVYGGLYGDDVIDGGDGNDLIKGGYGQDGLTGGAGADRFILVKETSRDTIFDFKTGEDQLDVREIDANETLQGNQAFTFIGSRNFDSAGQLRFDPTTGIVYGNTDSNLTTTEFSMQLFAGMRVNAQPNQLPSIEFINVTDLTADDFYGINNRINGTANADNLLGLDNAHDRINAYAGNDRVYGAGGNDSLYGGDGNDALYGGNDNDVLLGEAGNDLLNGEAGQNTLTGGTGADRFVMNKKAAVDFITDFVNGEDKLDVSAIDANDGLSGNQLFTLIGSKAFSGAGELRFNSSTGMVYGNTDADTSTVEFSFRLSSSSLATTDFYGTVNSDTVNGSAGADNLWGHDGNDVIYGNAGDDRLYADGGADEVYGGDGNDLIFGGSGNDVLYGGNGNDVLSGDAGQNKLIGGSGADTFVFSFLTPFINTKNTVTDFVAGSDKLDFSALDADLTKDGNQAFRFIGTQAFSSNPGELRFDPASHTLQGNTVNIGLEGRLMAVAAEISVELVGVNSVALADLVL